MTKNNFPTDYSSILSRIESINPIKYAKTRNFLDGDVTRLSPYLTHGVITTKQAVDTVLRRYTRTQSKKLIQELAWREFFQSVQVAQQNAIWSDLRFPQSEVVHHGIPINLSEANTRLTTIDSEIANLIETGYIHNHSRMWIASIVTNYAKYHWKQPSQWMYYHLLDGDLASNTLSWQWVAGSFSSKKYLFNQENLNIYSNTQQPQTFIDVPYDQLDTVDISKDWESSEFKLSTDLSSIPALPDNFNFNNTLIYHPWMLDPVWKNESGQERVLLFDTTHFQQYPISPKRIDFILSLACNIPNLKVYKTDVTQIDLSESITLYHPNISSWGCNFEYADVMFPELRDTYFKNFFSFWKKAEKLLLTPLD